MGSKTKTLFEVTFWAKKRVKAFTHEEARNIVEDMKDINLKAGFDTKVTTNTKWDIFEQNLFMQFPATITGIVGILWVVIFFNLLNRISDFPDEYTQLIGLICLVTLFFVSFRFPSTVGRWFRHSRLR